MSANNLAERLTERRALLAREEGLERITQEDMDACCEALKDLPEHGEARLRRETIIVLMRQRGYANFAAREAEMLLPTLDLQRQIAQMATEELL